MKNMVALELAIIAISNEAEHELEKDHQPRHIKKTRPSMAPSGFLLITAVKHERIFNFNSAFFKVCPSMLPSYKPCWTMRATKAFYFTNFSVEHEKKQMSLLLTRVSIVRR